MHYRYNCFINDVDHSRIYNKLHRDLLKLRKVVVNMGLYILIRKIYYKIKILTQIENKCNNLIS